MAFEVPFCLLFGFGSVLNAQITILRLDYTFYFLFRLFFSGPDSLLCGDTGSLPTLSSISRDHVAGRDQERARSVRSALD